MNTPGLTPTMLPPLARVMTYFCMSAQGPVAEPFRHVAVGDEFLAYVKIVATPLRLPLDALGVLIDEVLVEGLLDDRDPNRFWDGS